MIQKIFPAFGTVNSITLWEDDSVSLLETIKERLLEMHRRFSFFRQDSEIHRINQLAGTGPVPVSEDTFALLSLAMRYAQETKGAFDVTAGAASALWKRAIRSAVLPSEAQVALCKALCGIENLELDASHQTAFLRQKGMKIDLGGIVKGYAADEARRMLQEQGIQNACINLGGTVVAIGKKQNIGIQNPFEKTGTAMACLSLQNKVIVTSGSYEQCFFHQGKRWHHIIDPRTGKPSCSDVISVTLIGDTAVALDSLATGICCLGREAGMWVVERQRLSAIFVILDGCVQITPELQPQLTFLGKDTMFSGRRIS